MTTTPRSTATGRAGELQGPPVAVPSQVREITVRIQQLPGGRWRLTQPRVPGWETAPSSPTELVRALRQGFTEAQVEAHSRWRGDTYDAAISFRWGRPRSRNRHHRNDVYSPTEWRYTDGGVWVSPSGHRYQESTQAVRSVMRKRLDLGLPARPEPAVVESMTAQGVMSL